MAKSKKKNRSAAKSAVRKPRPAGKLPAKKTKPKNSAREKKVVRRSPKTNFEGTESPAALLLGLNHREKKLDPFVRQQKQKLLQLREQRLSWRRVAFELGRSEASVVGRFLTKLKPQHGAESDRTRFTAGAAE